MANLFFLSFTFVDFCYLFVLFVLSLGLVSSIAYSHSFVRVLYITLEVSILFVLNLPQHRKLQLAVTKRRDESKCPI